MVVVIGKRDDWGRQLGAGAIREGMKLAFFEMRAAKLIAKIHPDNERSLKLFQRFGFVLESQTPSLKCFAMSSERYLRLLRERPACHDGDILITELDQTRLRDLVATEQARASYELEHEIERAIVVDSRQVPRNVVTMNSRVLLQLDDEEVEVALVYPDAADVGSGKLSVCDGIGTAILGYREGEALDWRLPDRTCRIGIGRVQYQPEAAGHFHL